MNLSFRSLKVDFLTPMIFHISAAAELGRPALAETALRQLRRPRFVASLHGDSLNAQAPLTTCLPSGRKSTFARKITDSF
jgi:hypothetical protein